MIPEIGDKALVKLRENTIKLVNDDDYSKLERFEIIGIYGLNYAVYIPRVMQIDNSFDITIYECGRYNIMHNYLGQKCIFIDDSHILRLFKKIDPRDGMSCSKCNEFFPMAEPNQEDGSMVCWVCRKYYHWM